MSKEKNTLSIRYPELVEEWVEDLNLPLTPETITYGSKKMVFWRCDKGHVYKSSIKHRCNGHGCPVCSNHKIVQGVNDLYTLDPSLADEWDYELNELPPTLVGARSKKKVWWRCPDNHSWQASIYDRHAKKTICPYCAGKMVIMGKNDFMTNHPELVAEWDMDKNEVLPNEVHNKSSKKIWWKCKNGHSWCAPVYSRSNGIGCPECAKESQTSFPEQAIYYYIKENFPQANNRSKIGNCEADILIPNIKVVIEYDGVFWHATKEKKDEIKNIFFQENGYRVFRVREYGLGPLQNCENILLGKDVSNNYEPLEEAINSLLVTLGCNDTVVNIESSYSLILENTLSITKEVSLYQKYPKLIAEWDFSKNGNVSPEYITHKSKRKVWWICPDCSYSYNKTVYDRTVKKSICPICANKRDILHVGNNDLLTKYPELAKEWDKELNIPLKPQDISVHSSTPVWWNCKNGHKYQKSIPKRLHDGGCPYCRGLKVLEGYNDFASKYPELLYLWDYTKNIVCPNEISSGSTKKVWWICDKKHSFENSPKRIASGERCPYCSGRRIRGGVNSLLDINPYLAQEWDNERNTLTPDCVAPNSTKKYWWICRECGHSWEASCANRHSRNSGCPICYKGSRGRKL